MKGQGGRWGGGWGGMAKVLGARGRGPSLALEAGHWSPGLGGGVELEGGEQPGAELSNLDFQGQAGGNLTGDLVISWMGGS